MLQPKHRRSNRTRSGPRKPDYADAAAPERCSNRDDSVILLQWFLVFLWTCVLAFNARKTFLQNFVNLIDLRVQVRNFQL